MIHKVVLEADSQPKAYKKEFRKKLMTGGAVVTLSEEIGIEEASSLIERFSEGAEPNGVQELVVRHLKEKFGKNLVD